MANLPLVLLASFAFGFLLGFAAGLSKTPGTGRAFVTGLLGGGIVAQLLTLWATSGDLEAAMWGLLGVSAGGVFGLAIGIRARGGTGLERTSRT